LPPWLQSIPISKLAGLAELDTATLKQQLGLLRQSTQVRAWALGQSINLCFYLCRVLLCLHPAAPLPAASVRGAGWSDETGTDHHLSHDAPRGLITTSHNRPAKRPRPSPIHAFPCNHSIRHGHLL
jgi:hypothetical protein